MYEDDKGQFKGDALVVYFRPESVNLAIQMLDDSDFRLGVEGPMGKMRVQAADFSYKSQQEAPPKSSKKDLKKVIKKTQKLNRWVGVMIATETWADACLVNWPTGTTMTHLYYLIQVRGGTRLSFSSTCSHFRSLKSVLS
jgi:hypothetical protein